MSNNLSIKEAIKQNVSKQCKVKGCYNKRHSLYGMCMQHFWKQRDYGSPHGKAITKKQLAPYVKEIRELIDRNHNHTGVQKACWFFRQWMDAANLDHSGTIAPYHFRRLYDAGVDPLEIVITCGAVYLFSYFDPHFPRNTEALTKTLSSQIFKLIKREHVRTRNGKTHIRQVSGGDKTRIGNHIRSTLGVLFVHMVKAMEQQHVNKLNIEAEMRLPLK